MHEAPESWLKGCKQLGKFHGSSAQAGEKGMEQARYEALAKCAASGATDYAIVDESVSPNATTVDAKAFDCTPHDPR